MMPKPARCDLFQSKRSRIFIFLFFLFAISLPAFAEPIDSMTTKDVYLLRGEVESIKVEGLTRISIVDPDIVDIADAKENEIVLVGEVAGQTTLFVWDNHGKRALTINVFDRDLDLIKSRIEALLKTADIKGIKVAINKTEGKIVLSGGIPDDKTSQFDQITSPFADQILNLTQAEGIDDISDIIGAAH